MTYVGKVGELVLPRTSCLISRLLNFGLLLLPDVIAVGIGQFLLTYWLSCLYIVIFPGLLSVYRYVVPFV